MNPKVSVLVPVYNVSRFIQKCAQSLFEQTFESIEFIFVNDCSTDNSIYLLQKLIDKYPQRQSHTKIINHAKNCGIAETRNTHLKEACGDFLIWVDSDDYLSLNAVELLYNKAITDNADIVTTQSYFVLESEDTIKLISQQFPKNKEDYIQSLAYRNVRAALWGTLSKRSLWYENQISFVNGVNFGEDYFVTIQLFYFSKRYIVENQPIYYYNQFNITSYSSGKKTEMHFKSIILVFELVENFFKQNNTFEQFKSFVLTAKQMERNAFLLHTTSGLRRKYWNLYLNETKVIGYNNLPLNMLQKFILNLINNRLFVFAELSIFIAKILRALFKVKF